MGSITETATTFPGKTGQRPNSVAPLAEMLRLQRLQHRRISARPTRPPRGKSVPPARPTAGRPVSGFDKFYGFMGGETNQWAPPIYDGMTQVELPKDPNYHFMTDMTNQAIKWMQSGKSLTPDKPFFMYFAPGATHAPHHVPKEWIAKYKGKFDQGWDKLREETLARQIKLGVVPAGTKLAPKPEAIKDWDKLTADEKKLFARQMEVFAGFGEYADTEIGRLDRCHRRPGPARQHAHLLHRRRQRRERRRRHERPVQRDDLLQRGAGNGPGHPEALRRTRRPEHLRPLRRRLGRRRRHARSRGPSRSPPATAARATAWSSTGPRASRPRAKSARSGTTSSTSPRRFSKPPACRSRSVVNGVAQTPIEGVSMLYTFNDAKAKDRTRRSTSRSSATAPSTTTAGWPAPSTGPPGKRKPQRRSTKDTWELYDTRTRLQPGRTTWPRRIPTSSRSCRSSS